MSTIYKAISHIDRLHNPKHLLHIKLRPIKKYTYQRVKSVVNGVLTYKLEKVLSDNSQIMSKYKVSDFCLPNLLSVGVPLNPVHLNLDQHTAMSVAEEQLNKITNSLK